MKILILRPRRRRSPAPITRALKETLMTETHSPKTIDQLLPRVMRRGPNHYAVLKIIVGPWVRTASVKERTS